MLKGELFCTEIRATASGIVEAIGKLILVANHKFFPLAIVSFGFHYVVYFFSAMTAIMVIWGSLTIKDTDQLSLTEIQDMDRNAEQKKEEEEKSEKANAGKARKALEVAFANINEQRAR